MGAAPRQAHPARAFRYVAAWGMTVGSYGDVLLPRNREELVAALELARADGRPLGLRGTGNSYGDASLNSEGPVLDISQMNRVLSFDEETGIADLEPGVTVRQLWRHILPKGYWPRVVSGTSHPSMAGIAAMNIHGKNNFAVGTVGDAILDFDLLLPSGELITCSREQHADVFHAAIGGFGMLGLFARIRLRTKRVHSGHLEVHSFANHDLREMMDYFEEHRTTADYLVGWVDCFASGDSLGRGQIHRAHYLPEGADPEPERTRSLAFQDVKPNLFGVIPKSELWRPMRLINNDFGFRLLNFAKFQQSRLEAMAEPALWTHNEFAFLLDYIPNWKWAYGRRPGHGLIQFQPFLPVESAHDTYCEILRRSQRAGFVPYLGVFKRHRPDPFLLTYAQDGWSFALDYKVTPAKRDALWRLCHTLIELVLEAGGRFYFAKDLVLPPGVVERMYPEGHLERFLALKRRLDPDELLQTDLWRRAFAGCR